MATHGRMILVELYLASAVRAYRNNPLNGPYEHVGGPIQDASELNRRRND